mmetsp:Transcript_14015/g.29579  ORF Transcript_14015/g.29579 Transcript_14015/m.29579 type:complete len:270 (-) Transcript_14015:1519-2328(-)
MRRRQMRSAITQVRGLPWRRPSASHHRPSLKEASHNLSGGLHHVARIGAHVRDVRNTTRPGPAACTQTRRGSCMSASPVPAFLCGPTRTAVKRKRDVTSRLRRPTSRCFVMTASIQMRLLSVVTLTIAAFFTADAKTAGTYIPTLTTSILGHHPTTTAPDFSTTGHESATLHAITQADPVAARMVLHPAQATSKSAKSLKPSKTMASTLTDTAVLPPSVPEKHQMGELPAKTFRLGTEAARARSCGVNRRVPARRAPCSKISSGSSPIT